MPFVALSPLKRDTIDAMVSTTEKLSNAVTSGIDGIGLYAFYPAVIDCNNGVGTAPGD